MKKNLSKLRVWLRENGLAEIKTKWNLWVRHFQLSVNWFRELGGCVIGGLEKGVEAARVASPPKHIIDGADMSKVANYVGFKASMMKNRMTLEFLIVIQVVLILCLIFYCLDLTKQLRKTSYLLVPSQINGITEVVPNNLPASRVHKAFVHYLGLLGNVDSTNISEHYRMLKDHMSDELKINFNIEHAPKVQHILSEGLSETIKVGEKKVESNGKGSFRVVAPVKVFPYLNGKKLKSRSEYVVMELKIVLPSDKNTWGLEITNLNRISTKSFNALNRLRK